MDAQTELAFQLASIRLKNHFILTQEVFIIEKRDVFQAGVFPLNKFMFLISICTILWLMEMQLVLLLPL